MKQYNMLVGFIVVLFALSSAQTNETQPVALSA